MDIMDKLTILADSAKYDAACTSSGAADRAAPNFLCVNLISDPFHQNPFSLAQFYEFEY